MSGSARFAAHILENYETLRRLANDIDTTIKTKHID